LEAVLIGYAILAAQKTVLVIVNRTFEHDSPIGDGLLQLTETTSTDGPVYVIT